MEDARSREPDLATRLLAALMAGLLRALGATWRLRVAGGDPFAGGQPFVAALWHRGLFVAAWAFRDRQAIVPVSRSRDGERIAAVLDRLGFGPPPRGSSSRGGREALAGMIRAVRSGQSVGVLCDGPRGPARRAKPGVLAAARATGVPLWPLGLAARPALRFGSWDRVSLPLPFARVAAVFGPPLQVPREASRQQLDQQLLALERELDRLDAQAEAVVSRHAPARPLEDRPGGGV